MVKVISDFRMENGKHMVTIEVNGNIHVMPSEDVKNLFGGNKYRRKKDGQYRKIS